MAQFGFSPEEQLLLCCARVHLTASDRQRLAALTASPLDWQAILQETRRQSIVPLVYRHLHAQVADCVPADILKQLRAEYLQVATRSMALAAELHAIIQLLDAHDIAALPYKGPVLALQAYGDIALRTFTDLDVLVRRVDVSRAREVLAARGYAPLDVLTPSQERAVLQYDHNLPLLRTEGMMVVELHWRISPLAFTFTLPIEDLWDRTTNVTLAGAPMRAMSVDDLIIVLAVHGSRHAWSAVEWITGIAELMRRPERIDWEAVRANSERYRVARTVRLAVALAHCLLGAPVPLGVERWIAKDPSIHRLVAWVAARLFCAVDLQSGSEQWKVFRYELAAKDGLRDRLRDGLRRLTYPTGKDWEAAGIPDLLFPLYRFTRPVRLLARYLHHVVLRQ